MLPRGIFSDEVPQGHLPNQPPRKSWKQHAFPQPSQNIQVFRERVSANLPQSHLQHSIEGRRNKRSRGLRHVEQQVRLGRKKKMKTPSHGVEAKEKQAQCFACMNMCLSCTEVVLLGADINGLIPWPPYPVMGVFEWQVPSWLLNAWPMPTQFQ